MSRTPSSHTAFAQPGIATDIGQTTMQNGFNEISFEFTKGSGVPHITSVTMEADKANRESLSEDLKLGLTGDREAQQRYQANRFVQYQLLEEWAKDEVLSIASHCAKRFLSSLKDTRKLSSLEDKALRELNVSYDTMRDLTNVLMLNACFTHAEFNKRCNQLRQIDVVNRPPSTITSSNLLLDPSAASVGGEMARKIIIEVVPFMLKARMLCDLLALNAIELNATTKWNIASDITSVWTMDRNKKLRNIIAIKAAVSQGQFGEITTTQEGELLEQFHQAKDPVRAIKEKLQIKEVNIGISAKTVVDRALADRAPEISRVPYKQKFIREVTSLISSGSPHINHPRELAQQFYRLHSKGLIGYMDLAEAIASGVDLLKVRDNLITKAKPKIAPLRSLVEVKPTPTPSIPKVQTKCVEFFSVSGKSHFGVWLEHLDSSLRGRVTDKIERICQENYGHGRHIRPGIHEAKMDIGGGIRLYYALAGNVIGFLCAGNKATQDSDIQTAEMLYEHWKIRRH